jgi:hypothetical protein
VSWEDAQALHIFAPPREPFSENWVEQILGDVVKPIIAEFDDAISWIWVTRYAGPHQADNPPVGISIPQEFHANGFFRFVVFRLHVNSDTREAVQTKTIQLLQNAGCFSDPRGWIQYDPIEDVGGDRFIRNDAERTERTERARLIISFVDLTIRLMLHSLSKDESDHWVTEPNMIPDQNPKGSMFESVRHLFCNATGVPTTVLLAGEWTSLQVGTYWMHPLFITGDKLKQYSLEVPINY